MFSVEHNSQESCYTVLSVRRKEKLVRNLCNSENRKLFNTVVGRTSNILLIAFLKPCKLNYRSKKREDNNRQDIKIVKGKFYPLKVTHIKIQHTSGLRIYPKLKGRPILSRTTGVTSRSV